MKNSLLFATAIVTLWSGQVWSAPVQATVTRQSGEASYKDSGGKTRPLRVGDTLNEGSVVSTGSRAEAALRGVPGSHVALEGNSQVRLAGIAVERAGGQVARRQMTLELKAGAMHLAIEPGKSGGSNLQGITPHGRRSTVALAATIRSSQDV